MTTASRLNSSNVDPIRNDIVELEAAVSGLPPEYRDRITPIMTRVTESTWRRRRILTLVQEALGQLRLDMKYLMFDLEATRRERDSLQSEFDPDEFDDE